LLAEGFRYAGPILNVSAKGFTPKQHPEELNPAPLPTDLLVCTTRPPVSDPQPEQEQNQPKRNASEEEKRAPRPRRIERSGTDIEQQVLSTIEKAFLKQCDRTTVTLADPLAHSLCAKSSPLVNRTHLRYRPNASAMYDPKWAKDTLRLLGLAAARNNGFLLYTPHINLHEGEGRGPGLLAMWGQAGVETLFWCYALANRFSKEGLLHSIVSEESEQLRFVLVEWPDFPMPQRPTSLSSFHEHLENITVLFEMKASLNAPAKWTIERQSEKSV